MYECYDKVYEAYEAKIERIKILNDRILDSLRLYILYTTEAPK